MKKYVLGLFAVILAVGLSSFTASRDNQEPGLNSTTYYWFQVDPDEGDKTSFLDSQVSYLVGSTPGNTAPSDICDENNNHFCIVGFDESQIQGGPTVYTLKPGSHLPGPSARMRANP